MFTTGLWFSIYVITTLYLLSFTMLSGALSKSSSFDTSNPWSFIITSLIYAIGMFSGIVLSYYAGVYVYITGYSGNLAAWLIWVVLLIAGNSIKLAQAPRVDTIASISWMLFLLYQIGAFTNFGGIL